MELTVLYTLMQRSGRSLFLKLPVALLLSGAWCYAPAWAQSTSTTADTATIHPLNEVKVLGAKTDIRTLSPTAVQVLKGEELQRLNSLSVADALRYFTGIQLKDYGGVGGLKTINVRSLGTNHSGVFYDGVAIGNAQNGQTDLGKFSLDNIEAVELYNGQRSNILQPARAFASASALYLQSSQPAFAPSRQTYIRATIRSGSFGLVNPSVLWQQKLGKRTSYSFNTEYTRANGRYRFRETNGTYDTTAIRNNADIEAWRIETALNGSLADSSTWMVKAYLYHSNRGLPGAIVRNRFDYNERLWDNNFFIQWNYSKTAGRVYNLLVNAKYANDYSRYLNPFYANQQGYLDNRYRQQEGYFSAVNLLHLNRTLDVSLATDLQYNTLKKLDAGLYRFVYPKRYTALAALSADYHLQRFKIQSTLLGTFVNEKVKLYDGAAGRQVYSPSVSAIWQPFAAHELRLRTFYKHIFRMPTFNDLYYTLIGNTSLKPEYTTQYDVGLTYNKPYTHGILQQLSFETDAYYNRVKDKIVAVPTTNLFRWTMLNLGLVDIHGLDLNIRANWLPGSKVNWHTGIGYTYQKAVDVTPPPDASAHQGQIPYVPKHSGSAVVGMQYQRLQLNYSFIYTGERYNQKDNIPANYVQPWYTHDVSASWVQPVYACRVKFTAEVNNIFNQYYDVVLSYPMPGTSYRFTLSINY